MAGFSFNEYGYMTGEFPAACVEDCSHAGACDDDVEYWRKRLEFTVPRERAIAYMREFGAWEPEELDAMSDDDLAARILWIACGEIKEQGDWAGLVH